MKKTLILLAMIAATQFSFAQKSPDAVNKAVNNAKAATTDPKKSAKVTTWTNLGKAYIDAYVAPQLSGIPGMSKQELQMLMSVKPAESTEEVIGGVAYAVDVYPSCKYYFAQDRLQFIVTTNPYVEGDLLEEARAAYAKAAEIDVKGTKTKEITESLQKLAQNYNSEGSFAYSCGDMLKASFCFEKAAGILATKPIAMIDTTSLFNAGSTALFAKDYERAAKLLKVCIDNNFLENGVAHVRLAKAYKQLGDASGACSVLEAGFSIFPANQGILIDLINHYIEVGEDPNKIIDLLKQAQAKEPGNVSLFYTEGNIHKQLGDYDKAIEAYDKCSMIDPNCEWGFYYKGIMFYEWAKYYSDLSSNETDYKKGGEFMDKSKEILPNAIEPFEMAFSMTSNDIIKRSVSEFLKEIYFALRDKDPKYMDGYEKYEEIFKQYKEAEQKEAE